MRSPNLPDLSFIVQLLLATSRLISADRINCTIFGHDYKFTEWDTDEWAIINHQPVQGDFRHRLSLANGYLGISVAGIGPFFEVEDPTANRFLGDWPLYNRRQAFATIAGFYGEHDNLTEYNFPWLALYSNESVISGIPHWAGLYVQVNDNVLNATVNASQIVDGSFTSTLNITEGRLTWKYTWRPDSETPIHVEYSVFVHKRLVPLAAVQLRLTSERDVAIIVHDVLEGEGATYSEFLDKGVDLESPTIWSAVRPLNVNNRTAFVFSTLRVNNDTDFHSSGRIRTDGDLLTPNASSIGQGYHMNLTAGKPVQVDKFVGAASSDIYKDPARVARDFSNLGATKGFAELLKSHIEEWSSILTRDSVDRYMSEDGPRCNDSNLIFLSITAVTNTFYILQNTVGPNAGPLSSHGSLGASSIPVCGLGSDCYGGFIMWDAEVFIAPGLQVSHPFSMQQVTRYRQEKFAQAKRNVGASRYSSRKDTKFSDRGAVYPWTSGAVGNCTGTGPCFDYEYHLNGAIGISLFNEFAVTGDMEYFKENLFPISTAVAHFLSEVLVYNTSTNVYEILNATDPDEWAESINRPAYTHALISKHLNDTIWLSDWLNITEYPRQEWSNKASLIPMPIDPATGIVKEYEDMTGEVWVKQADVVLIDDLLHYHHNQSLVALDYYAAKQAENGPAMTYTSFSIVANEISPSGCSSGMIIPCIQTPYTYDLYSRRPYARAPWFQFSESIIDEVQNLTDINPAFPFLTGMGGANRIAIFGYLGLHLLINRLEIDPSLPPQIPRIDYRIFYWQGHGINATSYQNRTILRRLPRERSLPNANATYLTSPIPVKHNGTRHYLDFDKPVIVPNRGIGKTETDRGNILQCARDVWSNSSISPGQFPAAAIDGAASTRWQPADEGNATWNWLTVDLHEKYRPVKEVHIDWGKRPPREYELWFSNDTTVYDPQCHTHCRKWNAHPPVEISEPYIHEERQIIKPYKGNFTNHTFGEIIWTGRWVSLLIRGSLWHPPADENYTMPTVAEWALIAADGYTEPKPPSYNFLETLQDPEQEEIEQNSNDNDGDERDVFYGDDFRFHRQEINNYKRLA